MLPIPKPSCAVHVLHSSPKSCHGGWELEFIHLNYNISSFVFNLLGQTAPLLLFMICHSCKSPAEVIARSLSWFGLRNAWINSTVNVDRSRGGRRGWYLLCPFYSCQSEKEVMAGSRQELSSSPFKTETPFLTSIFDDKWNTQPEKWLA